jgi:hypothetical protein
LSQRNDWLSLRYIHGPIYALATTDPVTVPVEVVLWLDDESAT